MPDEPSKPDEIPTPLDLQEVAQRLRLRKWLGIFAAVVIFGFFLLNYFQQNAVTQSTRRQDCSRNYTSLLGVPTQTRDNLSDQVTALTGNLQSQLGAVLLSAEATGAQPTAAIVAKYASTQADLVTAEGKLNQQIARVDSLPTPANAVNNGFTMDGVTYPACPSAG